MRLAEMVITMEPYTVTRSSLLEGGLTGKGDDVWVDVTCIWGMVLCRTGDGVGGGVVLGVIEQEAEHMRKYLWRQRMSAGGRRDTPLGEFGRMRDAIAAIIAEEYALGSGPGERGRA